MITLYTCTACGHTVFPARQLCFRCGGAAWTSLPCDRGVVTAATASLAELRTPQNLRIIARLPHAMLPGTRVTLDEAKDGALWGSLEPDQT